MPGALLDRDEELAVLGRGIADLRAGRGRVIVVEGPAGIGKSSLLSAVATASGVTTLRARAGPLEEDATWGVVRQLFAPLEWEDLAVGAAAPARRVLAPAVPEPALAGDAMYAAAHGLTWLATNLAERGPALLVVDDVHWADAPSLRWLAQLARGLDDVSIGILCAVRAGEPSRSPELLTELLAAAPDPPLRPRALGPAAAEALVRERLPDAGPLFAHACHAVTSGNPFLLRALVAHVVAERIEPTDAVAARLSAFGPEQVGRSVERQLARLPAGATALAEAVTVLGDVVALRNAAALAGLDAAEAARVADALLAADVLTADARGRGGHDPADPATPGASALRVAHPLVAAALYARLGPGERAVRHAAAAKLLEADGAEPERVAPHLLRTLPADDAHVVATLRTAAERAGARGAPETGAAYLRRALAEPPRGAIAAEVRTELGLALAAHLEPGAPELLRAAVDTAASSAQRSALALRGARALGLAGHFEEAMALCRRALTAAGDTPPPAVARLEAELIANAWTGAASHAEAHERLRRPAVQPPPLPLWRANVAMAATFAGRPAAEPLALLRPLLEADALAEDADSLIGTIALFTLIANDELAAVCLRCDGVCRIARPRGWLIALAHGSMLRAGALVRMGKVRDAEGDARLAFDFKRTRSPARAVLFSLFGLIDALTELGQLEEADAALAAAGQLGEPPAGALGAPMLLQSRARLRLAQRRPDVAYADLLSAAARWDALGTTHPVLASWRADAAEALALLGDGAEAQRLAREQRALAERLGTPGARGGALRALAHGAGRTQRVALLEDAVAVLEHAPPQLEHVRALVDLGTALRRANRRTEARAPLRAALDRAERDGLGRLAERAHAELRATGARPRREALSGPAALTAAEHRVAGLAVEGYGNRAIAERLYVSRRTVETHLTHVFQKLGVSHRGELAAAMNAERDLLEI